jgi:RNA polymerase sigma factor (sigma-70 family)
MRQDVATPVLGRVPQPTLSLDLLTDLGFDIEADIPEPEHGLATAQAVAAVHTFVRGLPPRDRSIIDRHFWRGESQTDIARDLGVSKMAVSKAIARICKRGRAALSEYEYMASMH